MSFSYTLQPYLPPIASPTDPAALAAAATASIALKALRDWKFDFLANDVVTPRLLVTGADAIMQRIAFRWRFFFGEWFADQRLGMPWFQRVLGVRDPDPRVARDMLVRATVQVPGVASVQNMNVVFNRVTRRMSVDPPSTIVLSDGSFARLEIPFIL